MNSDLQDYKYTELTERIIKAFYKVYNILAYGFLEGEIKAAETIGDEHEAQLLNYLKATSIEVGLLLNFGQKPEIKQRAFDNKRKQT